MTCTSHQEIADRDLLAFLDGEASAEVERHLAECVHCRERAAALAKLERRLSAGLYRVECPASEVLGEYHLQLLPDDRATEIRQHVAGCGLCARELAELQGYLVTLRPDLEHDALQTAKARVRVWIARLVGGMSGPGLSLQPGTAVAGTRGAEEGARVYEAGGFQLSIEVQADAGHPSLRGLFGLLLGPEPQEFQAHLWQHGMRIASVPVDTAGNFSISSLEPGSYDLILEGPSTEVHVQDLAVE